MQQEKRVSGFEIYVHRGNVMTSAWKRILLITTSWEEVSLSSMGIDKNLDIKCNDSNHYPLGLAYIHSYLESQGHSVTSLFLNNHPYDICLSRLIDTITVFKPEVIGLQILTPNRVSSFQTIEYLHLHYPDILIVIGGIHTTVMYDQILKKYPYVIAVLGEGEITFAELMKPFALNEIPLGDTRGIAYSKEGLVVRTVDREPIENLNVLPFPKHEAFFTEERESACIITSRGCPNNCSFCCLNPLTKRRVRARSIKNVIAEIEWLIKKFPQLKSIWIHDDSFFLNPGRVIEFCDEIISRNINLKFTCSGRCKPITREMVIKLDQANFTQVLFGLESADENILKKCHKGITRDDVIKAFNLFKGTKIELTAFLIVGLPGETEETVKSTAKFVQKLQRIKYIYYTNLAALAIYPGTELYEISKADGILNDSYWLTDQTTPLFTVEHSQVELFQFKEIMLDYLCCDRLFKRNGFFKQFFMIPYIYWFKLHHFWIPRLKGEKV